MMMNLGHQQMDQQNNVNAPNYGHSEEGQNSYASTDLLSGIVKHYTKGDRRWYNCPNSPLAEFRKGFVAHQILFSDAEKAMYEALDAHFTPGQENIVRFKLPVPIYASFHVINGPPGQEVSGSVWIKFFDCYRVYPVPTVTWFTLL